MKHKFETLTARAQSAGVVLVFTLLAQEFWIETDWGELVSMLMT